MITIAVKERYTWVYERMRANHIPGGLNNAVIWRRGKREVAERKVASLSWGADKAKLYEGDVQNLQ